MTPAPLTGKQRADAELPELTSRLASGRPHASGPTDNSSLIVEFTERWDLGESPNLEEFLDRVDPPSPQLAVELIYRQYCLEEAQGDSPSSAHYLDRFSLYRDQLTRLFQLHDAVTCSQIRRWAGPDRSHEIDEPSMFDSELPSSGDQIGHFVLRRVLGEGASARVFLAEQSDLGNRLVVVKVSLRPSREPWLLVRARHAHIVDIISQFEVDDGLLQLICMPFRGGATLSKLLEEIRRSRKTPRTGLQILNALDKVAAPEFLKDQQSKTTRDLLVASNAVSSMVWMIARLAEALDYAFTKKVAHGDVKPSNILISADGTPMLLDFNLAQDWEEEEAADFQMDRGGTLAYMAPERLLALGTREGFAPSSVQPICPHCADLYSLGMVFLEMISGKALGNPRLTDSNPTKNQQPRRKFQRTCAYLTRERMETSPHTLISGVAGQWIQPGLGAILAKCLDPNPASRYQRGRDLATDLDRWRSDRPLIFASEPGHHATIRQVYRARRLLLSAVGVLVVAASVGLGVSWVLNNETLELLGEKSIEKVANLWDSKKTSAFGFSRIPFAGERGELSIRPIGRLAESQSSRFSTHRPKDLSKSIEVASLALNDYQVLGSTNWREREDVTTLPKAEREDLELWLMEQAYRYLSDLAEHPDSPEDWERASEALKHVMANAPLTPFIQLASRLEQQLLDVSNREAGLGDRATPSLGIGIKIGEQSLSSPGLEHYILGVAAECEAADSELSLAVSSAGHAGSTDERILAHYRAALEARPNSFWIHYRAAAACGRLGMALDRSTHLQLCLKLRPANPAIHGLLSSSLLMQNRLGEALSESDQAIELDPDQAEFYRTRAFIGANLGRSEEVRRDIHRYEVLSRTIPADLLKTHFRLTPSGKSADPERLRLTVASPQPSTPEILQTVGLPRLQIPHDSDELDTRFNQAVAILKNVRDHQMVIAELGKILLIDPAYHHARILRARLFVESKNYEEAGRELSRLMKNAQLNDFIKETPDVVARLLDIAWAYMRLDRNEDALDLSRKLVDLPDPFEQHVGRVYYTLARAEAALSSKDPSSLVPIVDHLAIAFGRNPDFRAWYKGDQAFNPIRTSLEKALSVETRLDGKTSSLQAAFSGPSKELDR